MPEPIEPGRKFTCALCGEEFQSDWTQEEAEAEMRDTFGHLLPEKDRDVVCDDCYKYLTQQARKDGLL